MARHWYIGQGPPRTKKRKRQPSRLAFSLVQEDAATTPARQLDRAQPATGFAGHHTAVQIIILVLEQGRRSLEHNLLALAASLLALLAIAQFDKGGAVSVLMINTGHIASGDVDSDDGISIIRVHHKAASSQNSFNTCACSAPAAFLS
jgi:hypothetical protein